MTGVPAFVLVQLINPSGRSSIAAEFMAGAAPSWYQALPSPVKSYIISIQAAIATGGNAYTGIYSAPVVLLAMTGSAGTITGANAPILTKSGAFGIFGLAIAL